MGILSDKYRNDCIEFSNVVNLQAYRVTFPAISEAASFIVVADGYIEAELAACAFIKKEAKIPFADTKWFNIERIEDLNSIGVVKISNTSIILLDKE